MSTVFVAAIIVTEAQSLPRHDVIRVKQVGGCGVVWCGVLASFALEPTAMAVRQGNDGLLDTGE